MDKQYLIEYCEKRLNKIISAHDRCFSESEQVFHAGQKNAYEDILQVLKEE